ncbi:hypothetical protein ACFRMQ_19900, partial [Kitasatospora sp. NPDC056783]
GRQVTFGPDRCKRRHHVERCFQKIKTWRGLATRYGKSPERYTAGLHLRGSIMWLKSLASAPAERRGPWRSNPREREAD